MHAYFFMMCTIHQNIHFNVLFPFMCFKQCFMKVLFQYYFLLQDLLFGKRHDMIQSTTFKKKLNACDLGHSNMNRLISFKCVLMSFAILNLSPICIALKIFRSVYNKKNFR